MPGSFRCTTLLAATLGLLSAQDVQAQSAATHADLARRALESAGGVKPGEVVLIEGGIHIFPILEEIAAQVYMAGGLPVFGIGTDRLGEVGLNRVPEEYFAPIDSAFTEFYREAYGSIDIHITLPFHAELDDIIRRARADTARWAKMEAGRERADRRLFQARDESGVRFVNISYPFRAETVATLPLSKAEHDRMMLEAVSVDNVAIDRLGRAIARRLDQGQSMRLTTPLGTDLTVTLADQPAVVRSGIIAPEMVNAPLAAQRTARLPGGQVSVVPAEADGRVLLRGAACDGAPMTNVRFGVRQGLIQNIEADRGAECANDYFSAVSESGRRLGGIHIGLNPAMKIIDEDVGYRPAIARGVVLLSFGFNRGIGGSITVPESFTFPLVNPTIEIDGVVIMRDGELVEGTGSER